MLFSAWLLQKFSRLTVSLVPLSFKCNSNQTPHGTKTVSLVSVLVVSSLCVLPTSDPMAASLIPSESSGLGQEGKPSSWPGCFLVWMTGPHLIIQVSPCEFKINLHYFIHF